MISLTKGRVILPEIQPQPTSQFGGERLVMNLPRGWGRIADPGKLIGSSPTDDAKIEAEAFRGFDTLAAFENRIFASTRFFYNQIVGGLVYVPCKQTGVDRRFEVNGLNIVIREYQDANKLKYIGVACVRLQDISVSVVFTAIGNAVEENRKIFEKSVGSIRFISKKPL